MDGKYLRFFRNYGLGFDIEDCGVLPSPTNGEVLNPDVTAEGQVATYMCFTGYGLVGNSIRTCQSNGHWSGAAPVCTFGM